MQIRWLVVAIASMASPALARNITTSVSTAAEPSEPVEPRPVRPLAAVLVDRPTGWSRFDSVSLDRHDIGDKTVIRLTLGVASSLEIWESTTATIRLPHGAKVIGLTFDSLGEHHVATTVASDLAEQRYREATSLSVDPAMLELEAKTTAGERYVLSMYPVSSEDHVVATVTIAMPRVQRVMVDADGERRVSDGATEPATLDLLDKLDTTRFAREGLALYAAPTELPEFPSQATIRNAIRSRHDNLRSCRAFSDAPANITLHFTVGADGAVTIHPTEGANQAFTACFADNFGQLQFPPSKQPIDVNYPIHFTSNPQLSEHAEAK